VVSGGGLEVSSSQLSFLLHTEHSAQSADDDLQTRRQRVNINDEDVVDDAR